MKRLDLISLSIFIIIGIIGIWAHTSAEKRLAMKEREHTLLWEKKYAWERVIKKELDLLENKILEVRKSGNTEFIDILVGELNPEVLKYRLQKNRTELFGEGLRSISSDVEGALLEIVLIEDRLKNPEALNNADVRNSAERRFQDMIDPFLQEREKISSMKWEDIPERRLNELRAQDLLKRN